MGCGSGGRRCLLGGMGREEDRGRQEGGGGGLRIEMGLGGWFKGMKKRVGVECEGAMDNRITDSEYYKSECDPR